MIIFSIHFSIIFLYKTVYHTGTKLVTKINVRKIQMKEISTFPENKMSNLPPVPRAGTFPHDNASIVPSSLSEASLFAAFTKQSDGFCNNLYNYDCDNSVLVIIKLTHKRFIYILNGQRRSVCGSTQPGSFSTRYPTRLTSIKFMKNKYLQQSRLE